MEEKMNKQFIDRLDISVNTIKVLKDNRIKTLGQLCKKTKNDLRDIGLENYVINKIDIELQLLGLGLKD